ncbi:MAG: co-chaperone DjlA [Aquisalimonadaceae bacterium]
MAGLLAGGFRGLVVGVALGFLLRWVLRHAVRGGLELVQSQFLGSTFAVMGALCKADGAVTRDEIKTAESLFDRLHLSPEQRESAKAAFQRGKAPDFDLDAEVARLARVCRGRGPMLQMFLQLQLVAIAADGVVHPEEHEMLVRVARGLGISEADVARLEALLRASAVGGPSPEAKLDDAYAALGVTPSASDAQIKRAYRRLMSQNHPDKLAGRGLPDNMRELAEEKTREIATAYNLIKDARRMT